MKLLSLTPDCFSSFLLLIDLVYHLSQLSVNELKVESPIPQPIKEIVLILCRLAPW